MEFSGNHEKFYVENHCYTPSTYEMHTPCRVDFIVSLIDLIACVIGYSQFLNMFKNKGRKVKPLSKISRWRRWRRAKPLTAVLQNAILQTSNFKIVDQIVQLILFTVVSKSLAWKVHAMPARLTPIAVTVTTLTSR